MKERQKIIISIPLVWGIRNFILSGVKQKIEEKYDVYYAAPAIAAKGLQDLGVQEDRILLLSDHKAGRVQQFFLTVLKRAWQRRNPTRSDAVFKQLAAPSGGSLKQRLRDSAAAALAVVFSVGYLFAWLERAERRLYLKPLIKAHREKLQAINPAFALSTSIVVNREWPLFRVLHALNIPVYTHILSFDNLTSRGYMPLSYFDKYLVWNDKMKEELKLFYRVSDSRIIITGTPQFDFHVNPLYHRSRDWVDEKLAFGSENYILYCANHVNLTPDEPQLVQAIIRVFRQDPVLGGYRFVLRLHPMDDYTRWTELQDHFPDVRFSYPWKHGNDDHLYWGEPSLDDLVLFSNVLRYSSLVLNIASTISIDAAIHDVPVVCVGFSSDPSNRYNRLYHDYHFSHHYEPIMKTGATPLAIGMDQLTALAVNSVRSPAALATNRSRLVSLLCGHMDGQAAERIANFLLSLETRRKVGL